MSQKEIADQEALYAAQQAQHQAQSTSLPQEQPPTIDVLLNRFLNRQDLLNEVQVVQTNRDQDQREKTQSRQADEKLRNWAREEGEQIAVCDGGSIKSVREWIRSIRAAKPRVPHNENKSEYLKKLISRTARGDLFDETEVYLNKHDRVLATADEILQHILDSFLGPDEQDALRDDVKSIKQAPREEIPAYNRRFRKAADVAYPNVSPEEDAQLTRLYLAGMKRGHVQESLFRHKPRLVSLDHAVSQAYEEWAEVRYRERTLQEAKSSASGMIPMEVDALNITARETMAEQERKIKHLQKQLKHTAIASSSIPKRSVSCYFCKQSGHMKSECKKRKDYWAKKGGEPRPLAASERRTEN